MGLPIVGYANLPVIDATQNVNMLMNIGNQLSQYKQMIEEAVKYEKELAKLGIDTGRVGGILGQLDSITNAALESLESLKNLPSAIESVGIAVKEDCLFLMKDDSFKDKIQDTKKLIQYGAEVSKEALACLSVLDETKSVAEILSKKVSEAQKAMANGDWDSYSEAMKYVKEIQRTTKYIRQTAALEANKKWQEFYKKFEQGDSKIKEVQNFTKKYMNEQLEKLLQQARNSTTQTDAQNFGNQLLLELLRVNHLSYDMMMQFSNALISLQAKDIEAETIESKKVEYDTQKNEEQSKKADIFAQDSLFEKYKQSVKYDALGLPILDFAIKK